MMALILGVTSVTTLYDVSWVGLILLLSLTTLLFMLKGIDFFDSFMSGYGLSASELNYGLLLLSAWVIMLSVLASGGVERGKNYARVFSKANATLLLALIFTFSAQDYILFYISFEVTLLPTLLLVLGWGYQPERIQAGMYMLFYTLLGSLPLLVCLLLVGLEVGSFSYMFSGVSLDLSELWLLFSVSAFLFKLPMYFVHLWLPKAHVEAPVAGSMILAGVLLKLGGYGLMIVASMFMTTWVNMSWFIIMAGGVGGALVGILCLRQVDMKSLVAYSSVAHMGLTLCGFVIFNWWGVSGAYGVMLGHGLCSSGMFFLVNVLYERTGSRSLMISKGAISFMPSMCLWWFLMCTSNMAAPPSLNLLGEVSLIISSLSWDPSLGPLVFSLSFLSGAYSLYLFSVSQHGKSNQSVYAGGSGKVSEFMVAALHWAPLNILFLNGDMFMFSV